MPGVGFYGNVSVRLLEVLEEESGNGLAGVVGFDMDMSGLKSLEEEGGKPERANVDIAEECTLEVEQFMKWPLRRWKLWRKVRSLLFLSSY